MRKITTGLYEISTDIYPPTLQTAVGEDLYSKQYELSDWISLC